MKDRQVEYIFKSLLIALFLANLFWLFFPWGDLFSDNFNNMIVAWTGSDSILGYQYSTLLFNLSVVFYFIAYAGLFFYTKYARLVLLCALLLGIVGNSVLGVAVYSGPELALAYLMTLGEGFVLALSYFSVIARRFETEPPKEKTLEEITRTH